MNAYLFYFLVSNSNWFIDKLKIEKDFGKEETPLIIHRSTVLSIAVIVIGGYYLADEIPNFCNRLVVFIWEDGIVYNINDYRSKINPLFSVVKITIRILLVKEQRKIVNLIERNRKKQF